MKALAGLALFTILTIPVGCTHTGSGARIEPTAPPARLNVETLKRNEYTILDTVEGQSRFKYSTFLHFFKTQDPKTPEFDETLWKVSSVQDAGLLGGILGAISGFTSSITGLIFGQETLPDKVRDQAEARAIHDALNKIPDADTLISPRLNWEWKIRDYVFGADYEATVTARGKAISIKTGEMQYTPVGYWPQQGGR